MLDRLTFFILPFFSHSLLANSEQASSYSIFILLILFNPILIACSKFITQSNIFFPRSLILIGCFEGGGVVD
jgi:hypothetical protein